jgi:hypothetical protein
LEVLMAGRRSIYAALAVCAALALLGPGSAAAQNPPVPTLVLGGHLYPKPFGNAYVYGHAELPATADQSGVAGQTVALYSSVFPYTTWAQVATLTTDFGGYFTYHQTLTQNTTFRAIWQGAAPVQSKDKLLKLPMKLTLKASHHRIKRGGVVTFTGVGAPAHAGARVELQQQTKFGGFKTFASTVTSATSTFNLRTRLKRSGVFRALFPGDDVFGVSASRPVRVTAVKKKHKR